MKKIILTALLFTFINGISLSQSGWFWQNPLPQGNHLLNVSYAGNNIVYISGYGGTLLKSTDSGNNYEIIDTRTTEILNANFINELTGFTPAFNGGFLKTTTGGTSWQYIQVMDGFTLMQISFVNNSTGFALVSSIGPSYIYKTTNQGISWFLSLGYNPSFGLNAFYFTDQNTGYTVACKRGAPVSKFFRTTNSGLTWDTIGTNLLRWIQTIYFYNVSTGYATFSGSIIKTTNGCLSWDTLRSNDFSPLLKIKFFDEFSGYTSGYENMLITTNAGANWTRFNTMKFIFMKDFINGIALGTAPQFNLIYKTTNSGAGWNAVTHGFNNYLWDVDFINENTGFSGNFKKIIKTTNGGSNWFFDSLTFICQDYCSVESIDFVNDSIGFAAIDGGFFAKTTNSGVNWVVNKTGIEDNNYGISFPSIDTGYIVTQYKKYLKTTNGGINWIYLGESVNEYFRVRFADNNTGVAIGMTNNELNGTYSITTNGGLNWTEHVFDSLRFYPRDLRLLNNNEWFFVGNNHNGQYNGVIAHTTNMGAAWNYNIYPNTMIESIDFPSSLTGYASGAFGVMYKTTNGGVNWLPSYCISYDYSNALYFVNDLTGYGVGSSGQIIKTTTGGGELIGIQPITNEIPKSFLLFQNYPNPFNPVTKIKFALSPSPQGDWLGVRVIIYDILGREIITLVNEQLTPGTYEITWDASQYSSGVYFYSLVVGDGSAPLSISKKMVLIR